MPELTIKGYGYGRTSALPLFWTGFYRRGLWIDLDSFFSIDFGWFFIRLFIKFGRKEDSKRFCRYLGWIL